MNDQMHLDKPQPPQKPCENCGKPFTPKRAWARFCHSDCRNAWHRSMTPEAMRRDLDELRARLAKIEGFLVL